MKPKPSLRTKVERVLKRIEEEKKDWLKMAKGASDESTKYRWDLAARVSGSCAKMLRRALK